MLLIRLKIFLDILRECVLLSKITRYLHSTMSVLLDTGVRKGKGHREQGRGPALKNLQPSENPTSETVITMQPKRCWNGSRSKISGSWWGVS